MNLLIVQIYLQLYYKIIDVMNCDWPGSGVIVCFVEFEFNQGLKDTVARSLEAS
jgi:hypothetical protein